MAHETPLSAAKLVVDTLPAFIQAMAAEMRCTEHPLPMPQFRTLHMLSTHPRTMTEIARKSRVSVPTMSNAVKVLESNGWVERVADPGDRRRAEIRLTASGLEAVQAMHDHVSDLLSKRFVDAELSEADLATLVAGFAVLQRVSSSSRPAEAVTEVAL